MEKRDRTSRRIGRPHEEIAPAAWPRACLLKPHSTGNHDRAGDQGEKGRRVQRFAKRSQGFVLCRARFSRPAFFNECYHT